MPAVTMAGAASTRREGATVMAIESLSASYFSEVPDQRGAAETRRPCPDAGWTLPWVLTDAARRQRTGQPYADDPDRVIGPIRHRDSGRATRPTGETVIDSVPAPFRRYAEDAEMPWPGRAIARPAPASRLLPRPRPAHRRHRDDAWRVRGRRARELGERAWLWLGGKRTIVLSDPILCTQGIHHMIHRWEDAMQAAVRPSAGPPATPAMAAESPFRGIVFAGLASVPVWLMVALWWRF